MSVVCIPKDVDDIYKIIYIINYYTMYTVTYIDDLKRDDQDSASSVFMHFKRVKIFEEKKRSASSIIGCL